MKKLLFLLLLFFSKLFAEVEIGCSIAGLLKVSTPPLVEILKESDCSGEVNTNINNAFRKTAITEGLMSVKVLHETEEVLIERKNVLGKTTCPPFCIEPMSIEAVITVGELEVLTFIKTLQEKKAHLLVDVRESSLYGLGTIPGAINLPLTMIRDKSKYQKAILELLGAKLHNQKSKVKWSFKQVQSLLIFGASVMTNEASSAIKQFLELGYPSSKLLYYRAGISSWKTLGLTIY